jgi:hypothetical protein
VAGRKNAWMQERGAKKAEKKRQDILNKPYPLKTAVERAHLSAVFLRKLIANWDISETWSNIQLTWYSGTGEIRSLKRNHLRTFSVKMVARLCTNHPLRYG